MGYLNKYLAMLKVTLTIVLITAAVQSFAQIAKDSVKVPIEPVYDQDGSLHRAFFGESWRKLWAAPVKFRVFHLAEEKGGLTILQRGGGMQTKSLRLKDKNGQEWVLRTIQKYPERVLPPNLRKTIAASILQDQISAEHPYSAVTVPPLAAALGVPHANPELVYVPDDPAFGKYQKDFASQVFLFEEREPLDAEKTDNSDKAKEKLEEDNDNRVDQKLVLRARLLDMLLGDWDRHEDQWRWEKVKEDKGSVYKPVPRDRDQVFYSTSGVFPWLVSRHLLMSKFQSYQDHIRSINRWNLNARNFDRFFMNELNEADWKKEIAFVQRTLTDDLIKKAIRRMPDTIYKLCGDEIVKKMIIRRDAMMKQGLKYYRFISSKVDVPFSDKREHLDITNQPDGKVSVKVNKIKKDGSLDQVIYNRTFDPKVTEEIRLYGRDGEDIFAVHGNYHTPIKVRMIGGGDEDTFAIDSNITGKGGRYIYDRSDKKNNLPDKGQAKILTSTDTLVNHYADKSFQYDFMQPLVLGSYSKDYGVQFITKLIWQKQGFRKDPYAFRQSLLINYGFGTNSLLLNYNGEFKQVFGKTDLVINVLNKGPNYTSNFFGIGNNSEFANDKGRKIRYYHNIYNYLAPDVRLRHTYGNWMVSGGVMAQYYNGDAEDNQTKYLNVYDLQHPGENVYSQRLHAGVAGTFTLDTRPAGSLIPHKGIYWRTDVTGMKGLNPYAKTYAQIQTDLSFYLHPGNDSTFVIANRFGGGTTLGNPAYYQLLKLGGNDNLRGYYMWRFTGTTMAYHNIEMRLKVANFTSYLLPGTLGVIAFNDIGRVWTKGEDSDTWHDGYGGGIYFLPAQLITIQGVVGFSKEGAYPYISAGFRF